MRVNALPSVGPRRICKTTRGQLLDARRLNARPAAGRTIIVLLYVGNVVLPISLANALIHQDGEQVRRSSKVLDGLS